jgi:uncharacterized protein with HEPN domain
MKKESRQYKLYLEDILFAMDRIAEYIDDMTYSQFQNDQKTIDAVIRNFEIIGEASNKIPNEVKQKHIDIPWDEMYLMRNKISHEYFGIDLEIIWDVAVNHLPTNRIQILQIITNS